MKKTLIVGFTLVLAVFSMLAASTAFKKREFTGNAVIQICAKDSSGKWQIVDDFTAPLRFQFNIADVASNKGLSTDFAFSGRSKKGLSISARLKNGAIGNSDLTSGLVSLDLPLDITVDGKKAEAVFKFTTESAQGAAGNISGRRAKIDQAAKSAQLGMVSSVVIPNPGVVVNHEEQIAAQKSGSTEAQQKESASSQKKESAADQKKESAASQKTSAVDQKKIIDEKKGDLMIVISGDGLLKSLEK